MDLGARLAADAVLCDLDGTLIDSLPALREAYRRFLSGSAPGAAAPPFERWNGVAIPEIVRTLERELDLRGGYLRLLQEYEGILEERYVSVAALASGAQRLLDVLRADRTPIAVVTSGSRRLALGVLERVGVLADVDAVVTADDVQRAKPAPDGYLEALRQLAVPASAAVALEDSPLGVRAAVGAGVRCIAVVDGHAPWVESSGATAVTTDLDGALELLQRARS